jgi:hypothetical protein
MFVVVALAAFLPLVDLFGSCLAFSEAKQRKNNIESRVM